MKPIIFDTKDFIKKAKEKHGNKYDYSKVEYVDSKTKVCIICPIHGEFWQLPNNHLRGKGCSKCKGGVKLTNEEFIKKANIKFKNFFNYSKVNYTNATTPIIITCPIHGDFWQTPQSHLHSTYGCPSCALAYRVAKRQSNTKNFIEKAKKVHGDKYDYSKVDYVDSRTKVLIICPQHGEFVQRPNTHLNGKGCPICGLTKNKGRKSQETNDFISKARKIHGSKYDYSKADLKQKDEKGRVCIICPQHGEFWQTPSNHLQGKGCAKCAPNSLVTTEEWIQRAKEVHGNEYDYSKSQYVDIHTKICITCPKHGDFWQLPNNHLKGYGCPNCNRSKLEVEVEKFLVENKIEYITEYSPLWIGRQEIDFYLPIYNIAIECQGIQHFQPVARFGGELAFHHTIELDDKKYNLCYLNGIELIYFSHIRTSYRYPIISTTDELMQKIKAKNLAI